MRSFAEMLTVGGKSNSLGLVNEVIAEVLNDRSRLDELYECLFDGNAWTRMRAADALEKVCREHPEWLQPYVDKLLDELTTSSQPSIQWHLAQIFAQVALTSQQRSAVQRWLKILLSSKDVDWIVAANGMATLVQFTKAGKFPANETVALLKIQQRHKSKAVVRKATAFLKEFAES